MPDCTGHREHCPRRVPFLRAGHGSRCASCRRDTCGSAGTNPRCRLTRAAVRLGNKDQVRAVPGDRNPERAAWRGTLPQSGRVANGTVRRLQPRYPVREAGCVCRCRSSHRLSSACRPSLQARRSIPLQHPPFSFATSRGGQIPAMAGLATDRDFLPRRAIGVGRFIIVFLDLGGMTIGAHEIPVLRTLRPMQFVPMIDLVVRVEVKPALAPLLRRPAVAGDG